MKSMWRKSFIKKSDISGCEDIHHFCSVRVLDETEPLSLSYGKDTTGQALFDQVCLLLNLVEKAYFGLRYTDTNNEKQWLENSKAVHGLMKNIPSKVLSFRVKFYPSNPSKLKEEITKYQLFMQVRRDLVHGRLLCPAEDVIVLAGHILYSEIGDSEVNESVLHNIKLFPKEALSHAAEVINVQKELSGQISAEVEEKFLQIASHLDAYGIDPQSVQDETNTQIQLGVSHLGISTFFDLLSSLMWDLNGKIQVLKFFFVNDTRKLRKQKSFRLKCCILDDVTIVLSKSQDSWTPPYRRSEISRLGYDGKNFILFSVNVERKKAPCSFRCWSSRACRRLWKYAIELQQFYTGKSEIEAFADSSSVCRLLPEFRRSAINLPSIKSYCPMDSTSLPANIWANDNQLDQSCTSSIANAELNSVVHDNCIQTHDLVEPDEPVSQTSSATTTPVSCVEPSLVTTTSSDTSAKVTVDAKLETIHHGNEEIKVVDNIAVAVEELKHRNPVRIQQLMLAIITLIALFIVLAAIVIIVFDADAATALLDSVFHNYSLEQFDLFEALLSFINKYYTWLCDFFRFQQ